MRRKIKTINADTWGGNWTELKLNAFEKYVNAYLKIMKKQKEKYKGWPATIYFDGFAGSGNREKYREDSLQSIQSLFLKNTEYKELTIYKGSAERVLSLEEKFDYYYFVDIEEESINTLKDSLINKSLVTNNCNFICNDVNIELKKLSKELDKTKAALVFLDPFGMQIDWESIKFLRDKRVDLWILLPSGVIVNRLLDNEGKIIYKEKMARFFGLRSEEIKNIFYKKVHQNTLFGENEVIKKIDNSIEKISTTYIKQLKNIFHFVTENPLILINSKNVPIYHFIFATNNKTAYKIAKYIVGEKSQRNKEIHQ